MTEELEGILGRKVDLVERQVVERSKNYIRRSSSAIWCGSMWRDKAYLLDMLIAAREVREFSLGIGWQEFRKSSLHQCAIAKALENIGEAARKVSQETRARETGAALLDHLVARRVEDVEGGAGGHPLAQG